MTSEKLQSLTRYVSDLRSKLTSPTPEKWKHSPDSYKAFLERELKFTEKKINDAKISGTDKPAAK